MSITLKHHPGRLTMAELELIHDVIVPKIRDTAPRLAHWLGGIVEFECARRIACDIADPPEPEMPRLDCSHWTDLDLAQAVLHSYTALKTAEGMPGAEDLMHRAHLVLCVWSRHRVATENEKKD